MTYIRTAAAKVRTAFRVLADHKYTTLAGTLVFFFVISAIPFLIWLTLLFGKTVTQEEILELGLIGWARDLLVLLRESAEEAGRGAGLFFLLTTLWSSTGFFYHLRRIGEIVYGCDRPKQGFRVRLAALALTFVVIFYLAAAGGLLAGVILFTRNWSPFFSYPAVYGALFLLGFFCAWLLNAYVCPYRISAGETVRGSLITAALWIVASAAFSVYLSLSDKARLYGAFTLAVVFLLWLYWLMICFTAGVVFNRARLKRGPARPKTL